jgi:hypothetical protein
MLCEEDIWFESRNARALEVGITHVRPCRDGFYEVAHVDVCVHLLVRCVMCYDRSLCINQTIMVWWVVLMLLVIGLLDLLNKWTYVSILLGWQRSYLWRVVCLIGR